MRKKNHAKIRAERAIKEAVASMPGARIKKLRLSRHAVLKLSPPGSCFELEIRIDYGELAGARALIAERLASFAAADREVTA